MLLEKKVAIYCTKCGNESFELIEKIESSLLPVPVITRIKCKKCGQEFVEEDLIKEIEGNNEPETQASPEFKSELAKKLKKFRWD